MDLLPKWLNRMCSFLLPYITNINPYQISPLLVLLSNIYLKGTWNVLTCSLVNCNAYFKFQLILLASECITVLIVKSKALQIIVKCLYT